MLLRLGKIVKNLIDTGKTCMTLDLDQQICCDERLICSKRDYQFMH